MPRKGSIAVLLLASAVLLAVAAPALGASPRNPVVSGTVYGSDAAVIPGATVAVLELYKGAYRPVTTLLADTAGHWSFSGKPSTYRFDVSAPSADPASRTLTMLANGAYVLDVTLQAYGSITGAITSSADGLPLGGATVDIYRRSADGTWQTLPAVTTTTLADGTYSSGTLVTGTYAVGARAAGHVAVFYGGATIDAATPVAVLRGVASAVSFALDVTPTSFGSISGGTYFGAVRTPVSGAFVWLYRQNDDGTWPATSPGWGVATVSLRTGTDGTYASGPIPLGNWKVRLFTLHTGSQWWQYVTTVDAATVLTLSYDGQVYTGIDGWWYQTE